MSARFELRLGAGSWRGRVFCPITLDATFPGRERWDGRSSFPVACGPGDDIVAGSDPDADKRILEERYCNPAVREPFIAALSAVTDVPR